jgi:hypothetical protein
MKSTITSRLYDRLEATKYNNNCVWNGRVLLQRHILFAIYFRLYLNKVLDLLYLTVFFWHLLIAKWSEYIEHQRSTRIDSIIVKFHWENVRISQLNERRIQNFSFGCTIITELRYIGDRFSSHSSGCIDFYLLIYFYRDNWS